MMQDLISIGTNYYQKGRAVILLSLFMLNIPFPPKSLVSNYLSKLYTQDNSAFG